MTSATCLPPCSASSMRLRSTSAWFLARLTLRTKIERQGTSRPGTPGRRRCGFSACSRIRARRSGSASAASRSGTFMCITTSQTSRLWKKVVFFMVNRGLKGIARRRL